MFQITKKKIKGSIKYYSIIPKMFFNCIILFYLDTRYEMSANSLMIGFWMFP